MDLLDWREIANGISDKLYETMVAAFDCGPFDGGCVLVAKAMQQVFGGEIAVITTSDDQAQHAVLSVNGMLWDFDGPRAPSVFLKLYNKQERAFLVAPCTGFRPMKDGDLPDAVYDIDVEKTIVDMIKCRMTKFLAIKSGVSKEQLYLDPNNSPSFGPEY